MVAGSFLGERWCCCSRCVLTTNGFSENGDAGVLLLYLDSTFYLNNKRVPGRVVIFVI